MNRLEKKCFIASAGTHALLFSLLFTAPLLFVSKKPTTLTLPELTLIPTRLIDGPSRGGGNPEVHTSAPPAPAPSQPQMVVAPPVPHPVTPPTRTEPARSEPKTVRDEPETRPRHSRPKRTQVAERPVPNREEDEESDDPNNVRIGQHVIHLSFQHARSREPSRSDSQSERESREQAEANARAAAQARFAARVSSIAGAIGQGMSSGTAIDVPGPGGEAFGDYASYVESIYRNNWSPPPDMLKSTEVVKVRVVIQRNGQVASFKILTPSGRAALDASVERLRRIGPFPPFPEGATDSERAFTIRFNLKPDNE